MTDSDTTSNIIVNQRDLPVASEDLVVHDDALNIDRQIKAGQRVPPDLVDAYEKATKSSSKSSSSRSADKAGDK